MDKYLAVLISLLMVLSMVIIVGPVSENAVNATPDQTSVNPNNIYSAEPAPMGIVDYGLGPGGNGYYCNSTSFTGIVHITSFKTYNSSISSCPYVASIQLNLIYSFNDSGITYHYWVQNVALLNTSNNNILVIDNIWNFTSSNAEMHKSTISGNGSVIKSGNQSLYETSGYYSKFNYKNLELRSISYLYNGTPHIHMEYNIGNGWKTYDTVNFTFALNVSVDHGFIVNGNGIPIDAGLIIGGPGNRTNTKVIKANMTMALEYWNGHNYQAVKDAYNHGSDTAEGSYNVSVSYNSSGEIPMANIRTGNTQLGSLYNSSSVAVMNFTANIINGYLMLNGLRYNYTENSINLTLNPGNYSLELYSMEGQLIYRHNYTLTAGNYYPLDTQKRYTAIFTESGLPPETKWSIDINSNLLSSTGTNITFYLNNGTYNYSTPAISGYSIHNGTGNFVIKGTGEHFNVTFKKVPEIYKNLINNISLFKLIIGAIIFIAIIMIIAVSLMLWKHKK
jgi:hypothetical protein